MRSRTRAELAREILTIIQAVDTLHGAWLLCHPRSPSRRIRSVCPGTGWHAWISTASVAPAQGGTTSYRTALHLQTRRSRKLRYLLEVWAEGFGKVLSAEFEQDDLRLISMKGGEWPTLYFAIGAQTSRPALSESQVEWTPTERTRGAVDTSRIEEDD